MRHAGSGAELDLGDLATVVARFERAGLAFPGPIVTAAELVGLVEVSPHAARQISEFLQERFEEWDGAVGELWSERARRGLADGVDSAELYVGQVAQYQRVAEFFKRVGCSSHPAIVDVPSGSEATREPGGSRRPGRRAGRGHSSRARLEMVVSRSDGGVDDPHCSYCGRPGGKMVVLEVSGRSYRAVLCGICVDLYGSGSGGNRRSFEGLGVAKLSGEEARRLRAGEAVRRELVARPLRPALRGAEADDEGRLVRLYGCCQWCGVVDRMTAAREVWAALGANLSRDERDRLVAVRSGSIDPYWLADALVPARDSSDVSLVLLRVLAHPDPQVDAGPRADVGARHLLRVLCTVCADLTVPVRSGGGTNYAYAMRVVLLAGVERRLRYPQFRGRGQA